MENKLIYKKIPAIMKAMGAIKKKNENKQQRWMFRSIDDVYNALHPLLSEHGVFLVPTLLKVFKDPDRKARSGGTLICRSIDITYKVFAEDGSCIELQISGESFSSDDKSLNKALSSAYKYALFQLFCIPTEELQDGDFDTPEPEITYSEHLTSRINCLKLKLENNIICNEPEHKKIADSITRRLNNSINKEQENELLPKVEKSITWVDNIITSNSKWPVVYNTRKYMREDIETVLATIENEAEKTEYLERLNRIDENQEGETFINSMDILLKNLEEKSLI